MKTLVLKEKWGGMCDKVYVLQVSSKSRTIFIEKHRFKAKWSDMYGKE